MGGHNGSGQYAHHKKGGYKRRAELGEEYRQLILTDPSMKVYYEGLAQTANNELLQHEDIRAKQIRTIKGIENLLDEANEIGISSSIALRYDQPAKKNKPGPDKHVTKFCNFIK